MSDDEATGYTRQESMKMRQEPEPVSADEQREYTARAKSRAVREREADVQKRVDAAQKQVRSFSEQLREVVVQMARDGVDPAEMFAEMRKSMERRRKR